MLRLFSQIGVGFVHLKGTPAKLVGIVYAPDEV